MSRIHQGSILDCDVDAIVNPANIFLRHGAGLARVIANAATDFGREIVPVTQPHGLHTIAEEARIKLLKGRWWAEQQDHPNIATGSAGWTSAGALTQFKGIVHAVGPVWPNASDPRVHIKTQLSRSLLLLAYESSFDVARAHGCQTVAFPAISAGIFGAPIEEVASAAASAWEFERFFHGSSAIESTFALMDDAHVAAFKNAGIL